MTRKQQWTLGLAGFAAILVIALMIGGHAYETHKQNATVRADITDQTIVKALEDAKVPVSGLIVRNAGGVVVVRGTGDKAAVQQVLQKLNVPRVANLVVGDTNDDEGIRRQAERQLASTRALDGCVLHVSCDKGVVLVTGTVQSDLQMDAARDVLRTINGVRQVKIQLATAAVASAAGR